MFGNQSLESFIIDWNIRFRYDRQYRKKYNIPFGSKEHLETNQIDIYLDSLEDKQFEKLEKEYRQIVKDKEDYKKTGKFLKPRATDPGRANEIYNLLKQFIKKKK
jgi:hypothetical protein